MTIKMTTIIFDAADLILPIIGDDIQVFFNAPANHEKWINIIDKIFMVDPNIFVQKLNMRKFVHVIHKSSGIAPNIVLTSPITLLEYYIRCIMCNNNNTHIASQWYRPISVFALTEDENNIVKYFLTKGANATINMSDIIKY